MKLPIELAPIIRGVKRLFLGEGSLAKVSSKIEELHEAEIAELEPSYFFPDDLAKIVGTHQGNTSRHILDKIREATARTAKHAPSLAYHLQNCVLLDGRIYNKHHKLLITEHFDPRASVTFLNRGALASTYLGSIYFGHWLGDDCLKYYLASQLQLDPICLAGPNYSHRPSYEKLFEQNWSSPLSRAYINELIVFEDVSQGSFKRKQFDALRQKVSAKIRPRQRQPMVYLRRGNAGAARLVDNEKELEDSLVSHGFVIADSAQTLRKTCLQ